MGKIGERRNDLFFLLHTSGLVSKNNEVKEREASVGTNSEQSGLAAPELTCLDAGTKN